MISEKLQKARDFETAAMQQIPDTDRPAFHVTGNVGWINDPNGFSCYQGEYHLFYQYHPYDNNWGPMHWGHVKTKDFIRWERLPIAMAPDMEYDHYGCFSGSAVETPDGKHLLMYTGVQKLLQDDGNYQEFQTQCIAIGDGVTYEKISQNPVLTGADVPEGNSAKDFRDPKLWYDSEEKCYYSVVGNRTSDGSGAVLLFRSENGIDWQFVTTLDASQNQYGKMWECPDFFSLDGEHVLFVSPQEMKRMGYEFHIGNGTVCLMGDYNKESHVFDRKRVHTIDYGLDFYAPQTTDTPDGRRIMIGWMQNWATCRSQPENVRWFGEMALPRELSIRDGRLYQVPVRELESYHKNPISYQNVCVNEETQLEGIRGRILDMTITVRPGEGRGYERFKLNLAQGDDNVTSVIYNPNTGLVTFDRTDCGFNYDIVNERSFLVKEGQELKIRVVMDRYSIELFFNDGAAAATAMIYTPQEHDAISFEAEGSALIDVEKYDLAL